MPKDDSYHWAYGVTTVPRRRADLLPRTLASLAAGGFDRPWLFVDGCDDLQGWRREFVDAGRAAGVTCRYPLVRAYANWCLALAELYARDPLAGRYAVFQDDVLCVRNLRPYLESIPFPPKAYWNLYLGPWNDQGKNFTGRHRPPYFSDPAFVGFTPGDQGGRGALGLVFDRDTVQTLLSSRYVVDRPLQRHRDGWGLSPRGFKYVDAAVVEALRPLGYAELVHHPSLLRHEGVESTIDKRNGVTAHDPAHPVKRWQRDAEGRTFPGESHDAAGWVKT